MVIMGVVSTDIALDSNLHSGERNKERGGIEKENMNFKFFL